MFCEVNLLGRVSKAPYINTNIKSAKVVNFSVAYNSTRKKQGSNDYEPCFIDCICFNYNADKALQKLNVGDMISIRGNLSIITKQEITGWRTYINLQVDKMICIGNKNAQNASQTQKVDKIEPNPYNDDENGVIPF